MEKEPKMSNWEKYPLLTNPKLAMRSGAFGNPDNGTEKDEKLHKMKIHSLNVLGLSKDKYMILC